MNGLPQTRHRRCSEHDVPDGGEANDEYACGARGHGTKLPMHNEDLTLVWDAVLISHHDHDLDPTSCLLAIGGRRKPHDLENDLTRNDPQGTGVARRTESRATGRVECDGCMGGGAATGNPDGIDVHLHAQQPPEPHGADLAQAAAWHFGLNDVRTYSGGTEATAFNPRAVRALRELGVAIDVSEEAENRSIPFIAVQPAVI